MSVIYGKLPPQKAMKTVTVWLCVQGHNLKSIKPEAIIMFKKSATIMFKKSAARRTNLRYNQWLK